MSQSETPAQKTGGEDIGVDGSGQSESSRSGTGVGERELPDAAKRALAEAAERRAQRDVSEAMSPKEVGGAKGPDPARYGDWEKDGIVSDF